MNSTKNRELEIFAVVAPGLEQLCAQELYAIGCRDCQIMMGGVALRGTQEMLYRINLWSRIASRILVRVGSFTARDFPQLYKKAVKLPWGRFIKPETAVRIRVSAHTSRLNHSDRIAVTVNEALQHSFGGRMEPEKEGDIQQIFVRLENDVCTFSVDSSGALLHKRGYRVKSVEAPLRETLAAALLLQLGWPQQRYLMDLFCGSGTLPIEAAMMATNRAPGLLRSFAFERWPKFREGNWRFLKQQARGQIKAADVQIYGSDIDGKALAAAKENAVAADVAGMINWQQCDAVKSTAVADSGLLVGNPPYGLRLLDENKVQSLYRDLVSRSRSDFSRWQKAFIVPAERADMFAPDYSQMLRVRNGGLAVRLCVDDLSRIKIAG